MTTAGETTIGITPLALARNPVPRGVISRRFGEAAVVGGDVLALAAIAVCIPVVIIAIGAPFALAIRFVLWMLGTL